MPAVVEELVQVVRRVRDVSEEGREERTVVEEDGEDCQQDERQHEWSGEE